MESGEQSVMIHLVMLMHQLYVGNWDYLMVRNLLLKAFLKICKKIQL